MLISYEPMSDVLTVTLSAAPVAQTQPQGTVMVGFDAQSQPVSIVVPNASTALWEHGGQVNVMLPEPAPVAVAPVAVAPVAAVPVAAVPTTVVRETTVVERPLL